MEKKNLSFDRGCEWGQPTGEKGQKILPTTDKTRKKLLTTDRKIINRLPTWTDIIYMFFQKEEYIVFFLPF